MADDRTSNWNQGAVRRGWHDTLESRHQLGFQVPASLVTAAFAIYGALLPDGVSPLERALVGAMGAVGGALLVGCVALVVHIAWAPKRQRDEARMLLAARPGLDPRQVNERLLAFADKWFSQQPTPTPFVAGTSAEQQRNRSQHFAASEEADRRWKLDYHDNLRADTIAALRLGTDDEFKEHRFSAEMPLFLDDIWTLAHAIELIANRLEAASE